jgi:VWFA-related protein
VIFPSRDFIYHRPQVEVADPEDAALHVPSSQKAGGGNPVSSNIAVTWIAYHCRPMLVASFLAVALFSQQPDSPLVIRTTTSLVQVRVIAEDSKSSPVTHLRREDFEILSDKKPPPLTFFRTDSGARPATTGVGSTDDEPRRQSSGYAVVVLDWLNTKFPDRIRACDQFVRLLQKFQPRQQLSVYLIGPDSRLVQDFTADRDLLLEAIQTALEEPIEFEDDPPGNFDARYGGASAVTNVETQLFFWNKRVRDASAILIL